MNRTIIYSSMIGLMLLMTNCMDAKNTGKTPGSTVTADPDNAELKLPEGFSALKVADNTGRARHIAVTNKGEVYIKLNRPVDGKGILLLTDEDGDGRSDKQAGFGDYGGTGIYLNNDYLYASSNSTVYRYKLDNMQHVLNPDQPEIVVSGLIDRRQHNSKSFTLDNDGYIYINIGAYSNACQERDRTKGSPGIDPCPILEQAGGIWRFKADAIDQTYEDGIRFATGLRNVVGLDWNRQADQLFVMMHGRDQLHDLYPELYTSQESADLPSEAMYALNEGDDCGWPYMYYDQIKHKKMLAPEYGGDGKTEYDGPAIDPVLAFPGHLAPNALLFYTGTMFPEKYREGAFVAFHGSWNRAPELQEGFYVAFAPFKDGKPTGEWEIFADNFAGMQNVVSPGDAKHRPCGLAQGPDGSLFVSDDAHGTIYRIMYK
ncbi:PQQ-dependent sugar dehydrogenase [Saccharicrinis sp. FJH54]|uniref:PQQ-dependent sugar dehydrogenase n=1 Tax=Saccharicrinis sp. FJH54 TaxID=3344665 RepID=UPI0035D4E83B